MGSSSPTTTSLFQLQAPDHLDLNELFGQSSNSPPSSPPPPPSQRPLLINNFNASSNHASSSASSNTIENPKRDWFSSLIPPTPARTSHHHHHPPIDPLTLSTSNNTIKHINPHLNISQAFDQYIDQPIPFLCSNPPQQEIIMNQQSASLHTAAGSYGAALRLSDVAAALGTTTKLSTSTATLPLENLTSLPSLSSNMNIDDAFPKGLGSLSAIDELLNKSPYFNLAKIDGINPTTKKGNKRSNGKRSGAGVNTQSNKDKDAFLRRLVMQQQQEANKRMSNSMKLDTVSSRENHIHSERERRKGMTHLYSTLHSLLPEGKPKTDRCSVLTETMKYIRTLRHQLAELNVQKSEVIASMGTQKPSTTVSIKEPTSDATCDNHEETTTEIRNGLMATKEAAANPQILADDEHRSEVNTELSLDNASLAAVNEANSEVVVRFFGGDAFITLRTLKKKGIWPEVLQILHDHSVEVMNVTLSSSPESDFHCIHAKVPTSSELNSSELHRYLKALVLGELTLEPAPPQQYLDL